ncbi:hypothetical protein E5P63_01035 [Helicobacter pylori]|uniref:hypothetical protein n=1 Tax=Helicobacter pylori TaxID=210 RepID=UPI000D3ACF20|nr:hypothetical protein [Helicobacter pylori]PUD28421.1 hypothetical protein C2S29_01010 [Helicobacter pylori]WQX29281.1 hypothetical protein E5P63_01035 [Helicobacter pylori]
MRQKNETATSFNQLKEITQSIQAYQAIAQTSKNANISEITRQSAQKPKSRVRAKKGALNPTKRAFSERQITAFRDHSQASEEKRLKNEQGLLTHQNNKKGGNNAKA